MLRTQYMHSIGLLNIQFWPNPVKKKTRSITIRSSLYIISDEFHLLYWLYEGNFKCFFCNCNLLRFGRVVCGQTYSSRIRWKQQQSKQLALAWTSYLLYTLHFTLEFSINIVDCTQCGKGHLLCSLLGANLQVDGGV